MTERTDISEQDGAERSLDRRVEIGIGVVLFGVAVIVPLLRQTGTRAWSSWLLEDLQFYYGQIGEGWSPHGFFQAYTSGYLVLFPRLLAWLAQAVPIEQAARFHALAGTVTCALLGWFTYHVSKGWVASKPLRLTLAVLVVLMPAAGSENTGTTVNTIWAFTAVAPLALISLCERTRDVVLRSIVVFFAATGLPIAGLFAPLALGWVLYRRTRAAVVVASVFAVGLVMQVVVALVSRGDTLPVERPLGEMTELIVGRSFGVYLLGSKGAIELWRQHGSAPLAVAAVVLTALFAVALVGAPRRAQIMGIVFYAYAIGLMGFFVWWRGTTPWRFRGAPFDLEYQMRYSVPTTMLFACAFAFVLAPQAAAARDRLIARIGRPVFIAQIVVVTILSFSVTNYRSAEDRWSVTLETIREQCEAAARAPAQRSATGMPPEVAQALCRKAGA